MGKSVAVLLQVNDCLSEIGSGNDFKSLLEQARENEPDCLFYLVSEAFDNYREAYVRGSDVDGALLDLALAAILAKGV